MGDPMTTVGQPTDASALFMCAWGGLDPCPVSGLPCI
jgi:hypothetical protein